MPKILFLKKCRTQEIGHPCWDFRSLCTCNAGSSVRLDLSGAQAGRLRQCGEYSNSKPVMWINDLPDLGHVMHKTGKKYDVYQYISNQKEHHKRMSFSEKYEKLSKMFEIDYDERSLLWIMPIRRRADTCGAAFLCW